MLIAALKKLQLQAEMVSLERSCHDEALTGLIKSVTEHIICMHLYTNEGEYDGFTVFETEQVTEVIWGNREHKAIAAGVSQSTKQPSWKYGNKKFATVLSELSQSGHSICLHEYHDEDEFDIADIVEYSDGWIKARCYGTRKSLSMMDKLIRVDELSRIVLNSPYQNQIVDLHAKSL